jgi:hypothetical protein
MQAFHGAPKLRIGPENYPSTRPAEQAVQKGTHIAQTENPS